MKITTKINTMLLEYAEQVEAAILASEFKCICRDEYSADILVLGDRVSIWISNGPNGTHCYKLENGGGMIRFPHHSFSQAEKCSELIMASVPDAGDTEEHD
ncbi:hypothetical protein [Sulfurovum mangrovi]|uniref:hypothetical protein n=1 Tax=Sulfurovum mangrovi TaxID=2893889 RepID=UPI001E5D693D|nr:hypothetical protein [Sulfurovum mangrovi]UFH59816.1 hypothetical protein LN246_02985 [Sulfurovum mangrovi]UFH59867.1 hypothetical protein LN246_03245 [Sulfurovum mangrovi]UFH60613.1 hypothetical protein LN246_13630 [Sulfurovum mangrovi]